MGTSRTRQSYVRKVGDADLTPVSAPMPPRRRGRDWVSKSDLISFLRCPYAFWQIDSGALRREEALDELSSQLIEQGREFHAAVASLAQPLAEPADLPALLAQEVTLIGVPVMENRELKIVGARDGLITAGGALLPIKAKSGSTA